MKRYMQWMLAAILKTSGTIVLTCFVCCCATAALLTSCSSDDDNNNAGANSGTGQVTIDEPVTDQMDVSVTYPLTTASLSQFAEPSTGAALIKRLPKVTASIADDTRIVLLSVADRGLVVAMSTSMVARSMPTEATARRAKGALIILMAEHSRSQAVWSMPPVAKTTKVWRRLSAVARIATVSR